MKKKYLVNIVIPNHGDCITPTGYRNKLEKRGYNFYQQIGSIGGASNAGTIAINNNMITRN